MKKSIIKLLFAALLFTLVGCGDNATEEKIGMLGFKLGQVIDVDDSAMTKKLGLRQFSKDKYGHPTCKFRAREKFREFSDGELVLHPEDHSIITIYTKHQYSDKEILDPKAATESGFEFFNVLGDLRSAYKGNWEVDLDKDKKNGMMSAHCKLENGCRVSVAQENFDDSICVIMQDIPVLKELSANRPVKKAKGLN